MSEIRRLKQLHRLKQGGIVRSPQATFFGQAVTDEPGVVVNKLLSNARSSGSLNLSNMDLDKGTYDVMYRNSVSL
jgi:hypothetical protein